MNRLYEKLKNDENFKDKLWFDVSRNCLLIIFHKYLWLEYFEGNYTSILDEGCINLKGSYKGFTGHWHIANDDEAIKAVFDFVNGNVVYIENTKATCLSLMPLKIMKKEKFEKKKAKYMKKKFLRIYSAKEIITKEESATVLVCNHVLTKDRQIQYIGHFEEGCEWWVTCGEQHDDPQTMSLISLKTVFELDETLEKIIAKLPIGFDIQMNNNRIWEIYKMM